MFFAPFPFPSAKMKQVSINEIGFILNLHRLFVNTRMPWYVIAKVPVAANDFQ